METNRTRLQLEGTEKQISYALNLIQNTFGDDLMKLERLRKNCESKKHIPDFPIHARLEKMESEWAQVQNEKNAGNIIEILNTY